MDNSYNELNEAQQDAVCCTEGPLLVLAGAGSGKTRVITHRIAHLISKKGVRPWEILALTFTNKAAAEMKRRVEELVGSTRGMWVCTFHAAAARLLRQHAPLLGFKTTFVIYDDSDQLNVIKNVMKYLNMDDSRLKPRGILASISRAKNELIDACAFAEEADSYYLRNVARVYTGYQERLLQSNAVDFDDLLLLIVKLFNRHPDVLAEYQQKFRYILVDEYQDTNRAQYEIIRLLAHRHQNLCVVGDDDQSIYQFRGADIRNILDFERDWPQTRVVKLEENYRSTGNILEAAYHVVRNNRGRKEKKLWTRQAAGEPVTLFEAEDEYGEARFITGEIRAHAHQYDQFAILYRTNAQSRVFEEILVRENFSYQVVGSLRFWERKEIKDILAYLRLIDNPADDISLLRIINVPRRGIGATTVQRLQELARERLVPLYTALGYSGEAGLGAGALKKVAEFRSLLENMVKLREYLSVDELTEEVMIKSSYLAELRAEGTEHAQSREENLREFLTVAQNFVRESDDKSLTAFLTQLALISDLDALPDDEMPRVILMTLHSAKGLEFPVVFLAGLEEGLFPHLRSFETADGIEEERRLCYVGITRAKRRLYLSRARRRNLFGQAMQNPPSRFLSEIPAEMVARDGTVAPTMPIKAHTGVKDLSPGDKVEHGKWGVGEVRAVDTLTDGDNVLTIYFPQLGFKKVIERYAPLRKI
ncbi:MAG: DNA helicase PcrA [Dethiobacter sp.]|jgi:DNA helicase-2/ATP-dependent DNA helicase PcrA|nr:DNA helicase PcrA [Dethiobacter sp.]